MREEARSRSANERAARITVIEWAVRSIASDRRLLERFRDLFPRTWPGYQITFLRGLVDDVAKELGSREAVFEAISDDDAWLSSADLGETTR